MTLVLSYNFRNHKHKNIRIIVYCCNKFKMVRIQIEKGCKNSNLLIKQYTIYPVLWYFCSIRIKVIRISQIGVFDNNAIQSFNEKNL